jgi:hypothetical protein
MTALPDGRFEIAAGATITISAFAHDIDPNLSQISDFADWGSLQTRVTRLDHDNVKVGVFTAPSSSGIQGVIALTFVIVPDEQGNIPATASYTVELQDSSGTTFPDPVPVRSTNAERLYTFVTQGS